MPRTRWATLSLWTFLPSAPRWRRETLGEVESTKSVSEVYSPIAGEVVTVNEELTGAPERLNEDPYGEGWICEIVPGDAGAVDALLDAEAYRQLIAD